MNTQTANDYDTPEGLAANTSWFTWLKDPEQRLLAATAYRTHPNQEHNFRGKADRREAAALALGCSPEIAAVFREFPTDPEEAARIVARRKVEAQERVERDRVRAEEDAKEAAFWRSKAGRRKARSLKQGILQVHYCNDDFRPIYVTNKVWHALCRTPVAARFMAFNHGTLGEPDSTDERPIYSSVKLARRAVARQLLKLAKIGKGGMGGIVGMRMQGWKRAEPEPDVAVKMDEWFRNRILPWAMRQVKKTA